MQRCPKNVQPKNRKRDIRWECDCSRERTGAALTTLGEDDLGEIIEEGV